jgi:D-alanyl-D-alanine carboxypeptidase/D-alanyl-D-alanine-endopeptidase (penicillin-binding protein 4)
MERQGNTIIVKGDLSYKEEKDTAKVNLYESQNYFLTLMKESMAREGIKLRGDIDTAKVYTNAEEIFSIERSFDSVIVNLNKKSDNLSAEMTLRALAHKKAGDYASSEDGVEMVDSLIKIIGLDPENYRIVDGSGVSHYNLVSGELLLEILKYFYKEEPELFKTLHHSFPIAGIDGTLDYRMKEGSAYKNVSAKTGTLSGVSCLSGYAAAKNGNNLAFSIMVQNHVDNWRKAINFQDEICHIIADYE